MACTKDVFTVELVGYTEASTVTHSDATGTDSSALFMCPITKVMLTVILNILTITATVTLTLPLTPTPTLMSALMVTCTQTLVAFDPIVNTHKLDPNLNQPSSLSTHKVPMNGKHNFTMLRRCGHAFSEKAPH